MAAEDALAARRRHAEARFGRLWVSEPDAAAYGLCPTCGTPRAVQRTVDDDLNIQWDLVCSVHCVGSWATG